MVVGKKVFYLSLARPTSNRILVIRGPSPSAFPGPQGVNHLIYKFDGAKFPSHWLSLTLDGTSWKRNIQIEIFPESRSTRPCTLSAHLRSDLECFCQELWHLTFFCILGTETLAFWIKRSFQHPKGIRVSQGWWYLQNSQVSPFFSRECTWYPLSHAHLSVVNKHKSWDLVQKMNKIRGYANDCQGTFAVSILDGSVLPFHWYGPIVNCE